MLTYMRMVVVEVVVVVCHRHHDHCHILETSHVVAKDL